MVTTLKNGGNGMFKNILLAYDGSENAERAAEKAIYLSKATKDATVEVVYVLDFTKEKMDGLPYKEKEAIMLQRRERLIPLEEKLEQQKISFDIKMLQGDPGPTIVSYANERPFDAIVIGSRGLNAFQEMVLGSVSHKVAKRVTCPVMIVK